MLNFDKRFRFARFLATVALGWAMAAGSAAAIELVAAPRLDAPQDISNWQFPPRIGIAATTRDTVVALFNNVYVPGNAVALIWTGSVAACNPGTTNVAHQQAVINRVNYFRALVELPPVTLLSGTRTIEAQAAALMMSANSDLNHFPPVNWLCYSSDGATGAGESNLTLGINGVGGVDLYMNDPGVNNAAAGHRRWILYPPQGSMATGDVPSSGPANPASNALVVLDVASWVVPRPATPNGIAWPPAGFVPFQNLPSGSNRWSFSFPGADFSGASVTMTGPGGAIPVTLETVQNGFGDNTIVFRPTGFPYGNPGPDTTYSILVSGMSGSGVPTSMQYTVTVIDPNSVAPPVLASVVSRKVHDSAGTFDLVLGGVVANPTTEPRQGPAYTIVFTFNKPVTAGTVQVAEGTATAGVPTFSGNEMRVPLTGVGNEQYVTVVVSNVAAADGGAGGSGSIRVGFLFGDVNQNRVVTLSDLGLVNAQIAQFVTAANFLFDVNISGTLSLSDKGFTNSQVTKALPPP